jgi:hypothetical protein
VYKSSLSGTSVVDYNSRVDHIYFRRKAGVHSVGTLHLILSICAMLLFNFSSTLHDMEQEATVAWRQFYRFYGFRGMSGCQI